MSPAAPSGVDPAAWSALTARPVAHRGLWSEAAPENTRAAFERACEAGFAIELDVQLSADGEVIVFHDDRLGRLTRETGRLAERSADELTRLTVGTSDETIPTLSDALKLVAGRSLVLVELKVLGGDEGALEQRVAQVLDGYGGPFGVLSFNPQTVAWFAAHRPSWLRGLNSMAYDDASHWPLPPEQRRALNALEHVAAARPYFLSLGRDLLPNSEAERLRRDGVPVVAWTIRSPAERTRLKGQIDNYMFEGFSP